MSGIEYAQQRAARKLYLKGIKMNRRWLAALTLVMVSHGPHLADATQSSDALPFESATVYFEQNATDKDAEVVFEATSGSKGLVSFRVLAPDGRVIVNFETRSKLGLRHFRFESPEPENDGSVQADFPEGEYTFTGMTVNGRKLESRARLSHKFPAVAAIIRPAPGADDVPTKGLRITWSPVKNLKACIVTIEQEEQELELTATLPGTATNFNVPDGFLSADTEYKVAIGTVTQDGNTSFVEAEFTTAD
jgi:hypothetical protein